jgi:hypothetical protein
LESYLPNLLPGTFWFGGKMGSAKAVAGKIVKQVIAHESN